MRFTLAFALICLIASDSAAAFLAPVASSVATKPSTVFQHGKPATASVVLNNAASAAAEEMPRGGDAGGGTATIPNEVFNLVKSIVGAGVLSLPAGLATFGNAPSAIIPAMILIAIMGTISAYTFGLIGRVCQNTNTQSYSEAWDATVGKSSSALIAFSCFIDCVAGNISYSMILADTFVNLLASLGIAATRTQSLLGVTGVVLLPLCLLKNLASLAPFSLVGICGMLYTTLAMAIRYFGGAYAVPGGKFVSTAMATPTFGTAGAKAALSPKSLILMCMLSNAYIAHFNAPKFLNELKDNTMSRFHQVIAWSFGTSISLYGIITALGFLTFGTASNGLILNNYSTQDLLMSLSRVAVAVSITCSYPLIFVGTRDGVLDLFRVPQDKRSNGLLNKITLGLLAAITVVSSQLTDLGLVASVGGATFGTALVFVYPAIMFLKQQEKPTKESLVCKVIAALGVVMGAIGTKLSFS